MARLTRITTKKLGELLIEEGLLTEDEVKQSLVRQQETGELLGEILISNNLVSEFDIARTISRQFSIPYLDLERVSIDPDIIKKIPVGILLENLFVPVDSIGKVLTLAITAPPSAETLKRLETATGQDLQLFVSTTSAVTQKLEIH